MTAGWKGFLREHKVKDVLSQIWSVVTAGGIDVTPLKKLIHELVDEEKIRQSGKKVLSAHVFTDRF